jgi:hypothetical protein
VNAERSQKVAAEKNGKLERDWNRQDASAPVWTKEIEERIKAEMAKPPTNNTRGGYTVRRTTN